MRSWGSDSLARGWGGIWGWMEKYNTELVRNTFPIDQLALVSGKSPYFGSENRTDEE